MFIPIRTETSVRRTPVVNIGLLCANILIFLLLDFAPTEAGQSFKEKYLILHPKSPAWYQFITYQFSHADAWHLLGNMLFLWVFGNAVNAKFKDVPYLLFYLAGGACAALVFHLLSPSALLGASGSIAAVTMAYMVLYPRSRVQVLYIMILIGVIEVPAMLLIGLKVILWDNILAPQIGVGPGYVAYSAHLAGYAFGLLITVLLLMLRALPRDQFDMLALIKRWNQRRAFAAEMAKPEARIRAQYGRVGRAVPAGSKAQDEWNRRMDERSELREEAAQHIRRGDIRDALPVYEKLIGLDPEQCLPADQQLAVGREYYATSRFPQAAAAFERYLACYKTGPEANEVRLLLGIITARDLQQYETAERYLKEALDRATNPLRREQAGEWLARVHESLGKTPSN